MQADQFVIYIKETYLTYINLLNKQYITVDNRYKLLYTVYCEADVSTHPSFFTVKGEVREHEIDCQQFIHGAYL